MKRADYSDDEPDQLVCENCGRIFAVPTLVESHDPRPNFGGHPGRHLPTPALALMGPLS